MTLGSFINGDNNLEADANNYLFQHEYGHYIQSQATGPFYIQRYGIPSFFNCLGEKKHDYHPAEQDANIRALKYFKKNLKDDFKWEFLLNPINNYDKDSSFDSSINQSALADGKMRPAWYDYLLPGDYVISGLLNWLLLENY